VTNESMKMRGAFRRRWSPHLSLWLVIAVLAPMGLWAYHGAGLELDVALLLSFCSSVSR